MKRIVMAVIIMLGLICGQDAYAAHRDTNHFLDYDSTGGKVRIDNYQLVQDPFASKNGRSGDAQLLIIDLTARSDDKIDSGDDFSEAFFKVIDGPSSIPMLNDNQDLTAEFKRKYHPTIKMPKVEYKQNTPIRLIYSVYPQDNIDLKIGFHNIKTININRVHSSNGITVDKED